MLSGACGQFFGNNPIWHFDGPGLFKVTTSWTETLDSAGSRDIARLGRFLAGQPWFELEPDLTDQLVVAGGGDGATKVTAARTADGKLALFYIPAAGQGVRELTLNLGVLAGPLTARWFNPAKDTGLMVHDATVPRQDGQKLRTPGDKGTGVNDWVLVLESSQGATMPRKKGRFRGLNALGLDLVDPPNPKERRGGYIGRG